MGICPTDCLPSRLHLPQGSLPRIPTQRVSIPLCVGHQITTVAEDIGTTVITVKFLDGTSSQKAKMKRAFSEWEAHANIYFRYESNPGGLADILVTFDRENFEKKNREKFEKKKVDAETTDIYGVAFLGIDHWITARKLWKWNFVDDLDRVGELLFGWAGYKTEREKRTEKGQEFLYRHRRTEPTLWMNLAPKILVDLFPDEKFHYGVALHEIGHTLGFTHAQKSLDAGLPDTASFDPHSIVVPTINPYTPETETKTIRRG